MNNNYNLKITTNGRVYPEIARVNNRITTQTVKDFLYSEGYISADQLNDNNCDYGVIARGLYKAFSEGKLSLNATKQTGIMNNTPVRMSTGLGGKMKNVWAFSTLSLCNLFCLKRMKNPALVCHHCYVGKSLHIDCVLNYVQNFYVLTADLLPVEWIPVINPKNVTRHPIIRLESFGDLFNKIQSLNYLSIARTNSVFSFALWTKNPAVLAAAIDETDKPENLSTVHSMSQVNVMDKNPEKWTAYFDHRFIVVDDQEIKNEYMKNPNNYSCKCGPNSCMNCKECYKRSKVVTMSVEMLRK